MGIDPSALRKKCSTEEQAFGNRPGSHGTILGPFHVPDAPMHEAPFELPHRRDEAGDRTRVSGRVTDVAGAPLATRAGDAGEPVMSPAVGGGTMSVAPGSGGGRAVAGSEAHGDPQASPAGHGGGEMIRTARVDAAGVGGGSAMAAGAAAGTPAASGWGGGAPSSTRAAFSAAGGVAGTGGGSVGWGNEPGPADDTVAGAGRPTGSPGTGGGSVAPEVDASTPRAAADGVTDQARGAGYGGGVHERGAGRAAR
jgi:hypothetical protein